MAPQIIHRDLKGANVLVSRDGVVKLADFGAATLAKAIHDKAAVTDGLRSMRGSLFWMAPEVLKGAGYGRRADIWSAGCTVIEMMTGKHPWPAMDNTWATIFAIASTPCGPPLPEGCSPTAVDFLQQCFRIQAGDRPTASQLLQDPFVSAIDSAVRDARAQAVLNHSL